MAINSVLSTQSNSVVYSAYENAKKKASKEIADVQEKISGVVYDKSESEQTDSAKSLYSINKMSETDRKAVVDQLKADQESRMESLMSLVKDTITGQTKANGIATNDDDVWKLFADGKVTVSEAAKKQAQEDISEDGYWGVKQTSQRLFDFASALAGDDEKTMRAMQKAMEKGFKEATKSWGKELPQISQDTREAANKLFEEYYESKKTTGVEA